MKPIIHGVNTSFLLLMIVLVAVAMKPIIHGVLWTIALGHIVELMIIHNNINMQSLLSFIVKSDTYNKTSINGATR